MSSPANRQAGVAANATGWIEAGLYVLCIALLAVAYAVAARRHVHPAVFILYSIMISAGCVLAYTGVGGNARAIILYPVSWVVGISNMVVEGGYAILLGYVAPADGSLMIRMSIPLTVLIGVFVFGRRPRRLVWIGAATVAVAVAAVIAGVDRSTMAPVLASAAACGIALGARAFASEFHRYNRAATTILDKIRVTALVTLVTACTGLVVVLTLMVAVELGLLPPTPALPKPADLVHLPTLVVALLVGGALFTAMTYLSFSSVVKIRSENFIATSAFMPLATFLVQYPAAAIGLIDVPPFDWRLLPAMTLAIGGVLLMLWGGRRA